MIFRITPYLTIYNILLLKRLENIISLDNHVPTGNLFCVYALSAITTINH